VIESRRVGKGRQRHSFTWRSGGGIDDEGAEALRSGPEDLRVRRAELHGERHEVSCCRRVSNVRGWDLCQQLLNPVVHAASMLGRS